MIEQEQPTPNDLLMHELRELIASLKKTPRAVPADKMLWDAEDIGDFLKVSARQVAERYASHPDFPRAIHLPTTTGSKTTRRWRAAEIMRWAESKQQRKRA